MAGSLEPDVLIMIMEKLASSDLQSASEVCHGFRAAVKAAGVALRPNSTLESCHLTMILATFPRATSLDLSNCPDLKDADLELLQALCPSLTALDLNHNTWLTLAGFGHLAQLSQLLTLDLTLCYRLVALPNAISQLSLLQSLTLRGSVFASLPESIGELASLQFLDLGYSAKLEELPAGIRALSLLRVSRWLLGRICEDLGQCYSEGFLGFS